MVEFLLRNKDLILVFSDLATLISLIVIVFELMLSRKSYRYGCEWQEKNKAAELAMLYKNDILNNISFITAMFEKTGAIEEIQCVYQASVHLFTKEELGALLTEKQQKNIYKMLFDPKNYDEIKRLQDILLNNELKVKFLAPQTISKIADEAVSRSKEDNKIDTDDLKKKIEQEIKSEQIEKQYILVVNHVLNSLEYFAMYLTNGVADESVVYQSLHQTYLRAVRSLYIEISSKNINPKDMYFTNITNLYIKWLRRDEKKRKKLERQTEKVLNSARRIKK